MLAAAAGGVYTLGGNALRGTLPGVISAANLSTGAPIVAIPGFADLVDKVRPAVVSVRVKAEVGGGSLSAGGGSANPFAGTPFEKFFRALPRDDGDGAPGAAPGAAKRYLQGQASGFLISPDGYIVTNNHVVDGATKVQVIMDDSTALDARVIGTDPKTDLALIKIDHGSNLPYVTLADAKPRVGEWVVAMGNPFGLGGTVTAGIVSAQGRDIGAGPFDNYIQIDAPVNRGNSGGPTFNMSGQVIGVNTAIYSPSGGSVGIAFDIPAPTVRSVAAEIKRHGRVERGWLGVEIQPVTRDVADALGLADAAGALVAGVQAASSAAKAGVVSGDVIDEVDGSAIKDARDLARRIGEARPGNTVRLTTAATAKPRQCRSSSTPRRGSERPRRGHGRDLIAALTAMGAEAKGIAFGGREHRTLGAAN